MKNLEGYFQDLLKLVNHAEGKKRPEINQMLARDCGLSQSSVATVADLIEGILKLENSAAAQLLKKVHYSQLINFDFKFASNRSNFNLFSYHC